MKKIEDYLHLYIGCQVQDLYNNRIGILHGVNRGSVEPVQVLHKSVWGLQFNEVKPILRRLSSMTEEEMNECWFNMPGPVEVRCEYKDGGVKKFDATPEQVLYLLSKGFDLFGLCDAGLAIDASTV